MKILIIGEYSGFAKNLKNGFDSLGHETFIFQEGDNWKKINSGSNSYKYPFYNNFKFLGFDLKLSWIIKGVFFNFKFLNDIKKFNKYFDVVLLTNYEFIRFEHEFWFPRFSLKDLSFVLKDDAKIYLSACGDDLVYLKYSDNFRYTPPVNHNKKIFFSKRYIRLFELINERIVGVIPVMCDYAIAYRALKQEYNINVLNTIPLPITPPIKEITPKIEGKIVIFHGLNRELKGTRIIIEALKLIELKYPNDVEVVIQGRLPLVDYLKLIERTNIVVDQCYSYSYGMNALYSMSLGKVVLSGNEPENGLEFNRDDIPIVNILPDVNSIFNEIEFFVLNPDKILSVGIQSREFVEKFHSPKLVANQYISVFEGDSSIK